MNLYGVSETNPISKNYHEQVTQKITRVVPWTTKGLRVIRCRLLSDAGFPLWDISYCHGVIGTEPVEVSLPFSQIPKRGFMSFIVKQAQADKVYAKQLGLLNELTYSKLQ